MDFKELVKTIQDFEGVTRKSPIEKITNSLNEVYNIAGKTLLAFGDDASAIDIGNNTVILFAADGIWGKLMEADPYWAGYCSVLVNVNDIAAMGGQPLAMVNVLSIANNEIGDQLLKGIKYGCEKFNVPMVGGHSHPDTEYNSLDVSIIGIARKDAIITSSGAKTGDKILIAIDLDGRQHPKFNINWDTTSFKNPQLVQDQIKAIQYLGENHLVNSGKDISNPGILGTLEMLLEASSKGAVVDLEKIPHKEEIPWNEWLKIYPGAGFVFTAQEENTQKIIEYLEKYSINTNVVGEVTDDKKLILKYDNESEIVFNQETNYILNLPE